MNDYQKHRFAKSILDTLFNTVTGKKITFFGWTFKKDTNDTRESAAIYIADKLLDEQAVIHVFDPKATKQRMYEDINCLNTRSEEENAQLLINESDPYEAAKDSHAIAILTEWDEFKNYDWHKIYNSMQKPAFVFDGRNNLDHDKLREIGFEVKCIEK